MLGLGRKKKKLTKKDKIFSTSKSTVGKFKVFDSMNLYSRLIAEYITGGRTDEPEGQVEDGKFFYSTNRIYTQKGVKKMVFLHDLPDELPRGFVSDIRTNIRKAVRSYNATHGLHESVSLNVVIDGEFYDLDLGNRRVQGRWSHFTRQYEKVQKKAGNKSLEDELKSDRYSDDVRRKVSSFLYIKEAKEEIDSSFYKTKVILEFVATSNDVLEEAEREFKAFVFSNRIKPKNVFLQTNEYQKTYMPMGSKTQSLLKKMNEGDVWSDDTITSLTVSTHGTVGDKTGVYHGVDIQSRMPFVMELSKGSDAQNILLTASTGEGKSNYAKMLYTFIVPMQDTFSTIVFDYEGTEYVPLGKLAGANIVSMAGGEGRYVNTMVIGNLTGDEKIDRDLKIDAMSSTERVFNLLIDERNGMSPQELSFFSDCFNQVYQDFGITDDPTTWHRSKDCTFYHIYAKAIKMKERNEVLYEYGENVVMDFIVKVKPFFEKGGIKTHWFREPISIQSVMDNPHLIFSFGMEGKEESMIDSKSLALRQLFASYLTMLVSSKNKANGKRTVVFLEELQRYLKQRYSGEIVASLSSGGRKLGLVVYYITNAPGELMLLMDGEDENVKSTASVIMSSMTTQIIGALWRNDMDKLIRYFNLDNARGVLYQLSDVKEQNKKSSDMKYCFFVKYRGQSTIVRMLSHPALEELPLYSTLKDAKKREGLEGEDFQNKLRMNVGEEAIKRKLDMATEEELQKKNNKVSWEKRMEESESGGIWRGR